MRSSVIVYDRQGHVCVHFILLFQWNKQDWRACLCTSRRHWQQQQRALRVISKATFQHQIAFYLTQTNEINTLLLNQRCINGYRYVCTTKCCKNVTFRWRRSRIYRGRSDLTAYMAGTNAHIRFISDLFFTYEWGLKLIREYRNPYDFFPAYTVVGHIRSVPHGRTKKSELGHLNYAV